MPRSARVFVEGGIYHVYNRVTRGEHVFAEDREAAVLLEVMREIRRRDGLVVLAWCIMSNHYHLAVRCTSVPLWRSMASIHSKVSKSYNCRYRVYGPFWQGRYKAKLVETSEYLRQLLVYIHLNPVTAGVVDQPGDFVWSGHRELVRRIRGSFVDSDQLLFAYGDRRRNARRTYLESIQTVKGEPWIDGTPGELPWWRFGRPRREDQGDELRVDSATPFVDELGRSTSIDRPSLTSVVFVDLVLSAMRISKEEVSGRTPKGGPPALPGRPAWFDIYESRPLNSKS